ncbi:hypothetical protein [Pseudooceanicola sp.]|uniref:hypothetical protein n=1 Tax=Pseudooceanicola sp. TaxID=1914328 RepID=UPI0035C76E49
MQKFDIFQIGSDLFLLVQAEHLLKMNTAILVPVKPLGESIPLSKLTVEVGFDGQAYRIQAHMPLTVDARRLRHLTPAGRLSLDQGQKVMDGLNTILWGF